MRTVDRSQSEGRRLGHGSSASMRGSLAAVAQRGKEGQKTMAQLGIPSRIPKHTETDVPLRDPERDHALSRKGSEPGWLKSHGPTGDLKPGPATGRGHWAPGHSQGPRVTPELTVGRSSAGL